MTKEEKQLRHEIIFLLDRLDELYLDDETYDLIRDWEGHVEPSIARLRIMLYDNKPAKR